MKINRRFVTVGATFLVAALTGHLMQNGAAIGGQLFGSADAGDDPAGAMVVQAEAAVGAGESQPRIDEASVMELSADMDASAVDLDHPALPQLPQASAVPLVGGAALAARMIKVDAGPARTPSAADATYTAFGLTCAATTIDVADAKPALLVVTIMAPCHANERMTLGHAGIEASLVTDAEGRATVTVPALSAKGDLLVQFVTGEQLRTVHAVPDLASVQRVAIAADGSSGFMLNIYENGAAFGSAGHVRAAAMRDAATGDGGFMVTLGDATLEQANLVQIYSAPATLADRRIEIETQVTTETCGKAASAKAVWTAGAVTSTDVVSLTVPGCEAAGDLIVMDMTPFFTGATRQALAD